MIIVKSFGMFKTLLELIKESNISYKIIGNYADAKPNMQALGKEYENTQINFKFLIVSSMITFTYSGYIKYSDSEINDVKEYFEQLNIVHANLEIGNDIKIS